MTCSRPSFILFALALKVACSRAGRIAHGTAGFTPFSILNEINLTLPRDLRFLGDSAPFHVICVF